ncbi:lytic polysaccharide monooxygenase [Streptomyces sp. GC420]|uniref:lytic polysaccharide monooxygenase n=1 Tax=Streptomyces sp. GC420 TaxID=2697568 RepID=UPI0014151DC8|nr:lytic polysaccharide monooxygenase [Streptomyces sp. GC420]NBM18239.1 chitin-binding protein [Streptomyces sp. GC420]
MTVHRNAVTAALAGAVPLLLTALTAGPAAAHGAPTDPLSRAAACSPDGGQAARSAACRAAVARHGGRLYADWDNMRIADVRGRDRQFVPDGRLCSAGIDTYGGLDLPRADWPSTRLTPGATRTLGYRTTIPHTGTFELYMTKQGYDPTRPLKWSDLDAEPFAKVTDPALTDGAYRIRVTLPADRNGRHLLYTIWRNTSTPDTYYSCSDVVFPAAAEDTGSGGSGGGAAPTPTAAGTSKPPTGRPAPGATEATTPAEAGSSRPAAGAPRAAATADRPVAAGSGEPRQSMALPLAAGGAGALAVAGGVAVLMRRRARPNRHAAR